MEYIAWYIIMFKATYYQLLLLYYNVVVSVLVADQCSFSHNTAAVAPHYMLHTYYMTLYLFS